MAPNRIDPFPACNFIVEIDGVTKAGFMEVTGLEVEIAAIDYREGADKPLTVRKLPGLVKYNNIVLKRGLTLDHSLWDWIKSVVNGNVQRTTVSITLLDDQRQPAVRWVVREAWPSKWEGPNLNAQGNTVAIETLEITHEGLDLVE
jgi:phage tail-like protein